jgi:WD40 repeat protein
VARLGTVRLRPGGRVKYLAFSPDGKRLASWTEDFRKASCLSVWDTATGRELRQVELPGVRAFAFAWLADGRGVAVLELGDESFYVFDFADEKAQRPPLPRRPLGGKMAPGEDREVYGCFAIAPDGKLLAAGRRGFQDKERPVHVWELAAGRPVAGLKPPRLLDRQPGNCTALAFTPDGRSLLGFSRAGKAEGEQLLVWDVAGGGRRKQMTVPSPERQGYTSVYAIAPDGRTLALGMLDGTARLVDLATGEGRRSLMVNPEKPNVGFGGVSAVAFSRDGKHLIAGAPDNALRVWEWATGREVRALRGHHSWVEAVAVSADGRRLASGGQDGLIRLWDAATGADVCPQDGHRFGIWGVAVAPDGKNAATRSSDGTLRVWETASGRQVRRIDLDGPASGAVAFTPDGRALAAVGGDRFRLWDAATGKAVRPPGALADRPCEVFRFAADGKALLTAHEGKVSAWGWPAGRLVRTFELPADASKPGKVVSTCLALSADGRALVTLSQRRWGNTVGYGEVDLWDVAGGRRVRRLVSSAGTFQDAAFSEGGEGLFLGGSGYEGAGAAAGAGPAGNPLTLIDLARGGVLRRFASGQVVQKGHLRWVQALAQPPDGRSLASAENDGSVLIFESATGLLRRRLAGHRAAVRSLAFTPDGKRLVTASSDQTGLVWDVSLAALGGPAAGGKAGLWADLASTEPDAARRALAGLAAAPEVAVRLFRDRLRPATAPEGATLDRLVADLDSDRFEVREKAFTELDRLGATAAAGLRERAGRSQSVEVRGRIARLLEKHDPVTVGPERLRELRALEVLEQIGTPEARQVLVTLATGASGARLTREAKASLRRLAGRPVANP